MLAGCAACALALGACGGGAASPPAPQAAAPSPATATSPPPTSTATTPPTVTSPPTRTSTPTTTTPATPPTQPKPADTVAAAPPRTTSAPHPPKTTTSTGPPAHPIQETAQLQLVSRSSPIQYAQHGQVSGTFDGEMALNAKVTPKGVAVTFTVQIAGGTVSGRGLAIPRITGAAMVPLSGTAAITTGTGAYAHIEGHGLLVTGRAALDGSKAVVRLTGTVTY